MILAGELSVSSPRCPREPHWQYPDGRAGVDTVQYPTAVTITPPQMDAVVLVPDAFHGKWNYKLLPR